MAWQRYSGDMVYEIRRQTGSHLRLTSSACGREHHNTIPAHPSLKLGTLSAILSDVAAYLSSGAREFRTRAVQAVGAGYDDSIGREELERSKMKIREILN